jgi:hypothetical protein
MITDTIIEDKEFDEEHSDRGRCAELESVGRRRLSGKLETAELGWLQVRGAECSFREKDKKR